ncbi:CoA transferase [Rhodococcus sp. ABRD24]|uniref:CaiB/BaiF CoA transferase family protein n=1 Tax=Rhodococcus sp. ABRD24 TaxID=2507582 RepID=UPI00103C7107|nr:CaiB/BaiF CoA-transferase family protein [Rhodococcus sp. ABRD24]QBJ95762.1 CoA transferase [Rhodococcus sp. ABRD24]
MAGPLTGLRVVEMAGIGPVPHAAMMLADMGAHVVRVQRRSATTPDDGVRDADRAMQRGKRIVLADLKDVDDLAQVRRLVEVADVLLEGFRPSVMERLGLGPEEFADTNPGLVYGRMTGWGQQGPWAARAGHDINYLALTGLLETMGPHDGVPVPPLSLVGDFGGGSMLLVQGVLAALWERDRTGLGQVIDAAMVDGAGLLAQLQWSWRAAGRWSDRRGTNMLDGSAPFYGTYRCADDRFVAVGALEDQFYAALVAGLQLSPEDLPDRWDRGRWAELRTVFAGRFATRTRDEWAEMFDGVDACVTPVLAFGEAPEHPHNTARTSFVTVDGIEQPAPAPRFSRGAGSAPGPAVYDEIDAVVGQWCEPDACGRGIG